MSALLIEAQALFKRYRGAKAALADFSMKVRAGEVVLLAGPNGSGKSTLLKILAGLLAPSAGTARVAGFAAGSLEARARLGYLPEQPAWHPYLTARETLAHYAALSGVPKKEMPARIDRVLAEAGLVKQVEARVGTFSRGMLQRLGLAQTALHQPQVLLLDEPLSGLDPMAAEQFVRWLEAQKQRGAATLVATHQLEALETIADQVVVLKDGHARVVGTLQQVCAGRTLGQAVHAALCSEEAR